MPALSSMKKWSLVVGLIALGLEGCSTLNEFSVEEGHRAFRRTLQHHVGTSIDSGRGWARKEVTVSREILPDGLIKYRQAVSRECIAVLYVDPAARRIVDVGFEGSERQCATPP